MVTVVHPHEVELEQLEAADLVLVDYRLEYWPARNAQPISMRPATGMALAAVLREQADRSLEEAKSYRLNAFALHTGHLGEIRGRMPSATAEHVLARLNNLEWVFARTTARRYSQIVSLARSVRELPRKWPAEPREAAALVEQLLGMDRDSNWHERCWRDVVDCRAPVYENSSSAQALLLLRWILHEILPYPCFLWEGALGGSAARYHRGSLAENNSGQ